MPDEEWIAMPMGVFSRTMRFWMLVSWTLGLFTGGLAVVTIYTAHELWG